MPGKSVVKARFKVAELGQGSESQPHRGNRAGGAATKATASSRRWVPPTARENVDPIQLVFRKIRGILNKITPDNFDKLSFELTHIPAINNKETLKGAILLVYDKALEESHYTYMYAQLCRRLNDLVPNFEEPGSQSTTFRKLLLHKCQEEFENRRLATAAFERQDGLTAEEEEQRSLAKRKMLGNIRFVGELFKIGVLHEAIIHSCIKELLEKKKNQTMEDTVENIECLCHFMTTVGGKLDSTKARAWMDKYFERMKSLATYPDFPPRIRFMLLDVIELRANSWQPRRSSSDRGPRPIHEIRQEVYQEKAVHHPLPPFSQPGFRGQYAPPPGPTGDEGFLSSPPDTKDQHLFSPQEPVHMVFPPHPYPHSHPHPHPHPHPPTMQQEVSMGGGVVMEGATEFAKPLEKKTIRKLPKAKTDNTVSLRPSMASLKLGSSSRSKLSSQDSSDSTASTSLEGTEPILEKGRDNVKVEPVRPALPRTRDDSSDEDEQTTLANNEPSILPHPPQGPIPPHMYGPPGHSYPPHMMPPRDPFYPRGPGPIIHPIPSPHMPPRHMMYPPPHGPMPRGPMLPPPGGHPVPPGPRYYGPPPPLGPPMPPYPGQMYRPPPQGLQPSYRPPPGGWTTPPLDRPHPPEHGELEKGPLPPHLERNEPLKVKYVASKSAKKGGVSSGKKIVQDENEKIMDPIIKKFLKSHDVEKTLEAIEGATTVPKETLCTLLVTKTLEKSEDDRTHISDLIKQLHTKELISSPNFVQAVNKVLASAGEYESSLPQYKTYLAGFIARATAHEVVEFRAIATTFDLGSHHPTLLVVLQALTTLVGEDAVFQKVQSSGVKLASLLPVEFRSHEALAELMESKKLGFLYPLRKIQIELSAKLRQQDTTAVAIYKWIKNNVDSSLYPTPEFVMVLTKCIFEYVCSESTLTVPLSQADNPSKAAIAKEKLMMQKFKILIEKFVSDDIQLQISVLYATQTFCHKKLFPKGLLLRLFSYLYDMDVVEEDSFFKWKEDLSQEYPGKGRALFQVNHWLVLLAEAEDEESSDDEA